MIAENTARIGGGATMRRRWVDGLRGPRGAEDPVPAEETVAETLSALREKAGIRIVGTPGSPSGMTAEGGA